MSGRTGMSRSRRIWSASGVVGPFAASARNCRRQADSAGSTAAELAGKLSTCSAQSLPAVKQARLRSTCLW